MALTITVGGNDITAYVYVESLKIEEVAADMVATCSFWAHDHNAVVAIAEKDPITIVDGATTIFAGEVADVELAQHGLTREWRVSCQDNNILLEETAVQSASYVTGTADSDILQDLFTTYRSDINATTYVSTLQASLYTTLTFEAMTLRESLDELCSRTGGRYYVDFDMNLHYFSTESNPAAWNLSTSPNGSTTFGFGGFRRYGSATRLANKVLVKGEGIEGWVSDATSIAEYGERHAVSRDRRITTSDGVQNRGDAILDRYDQPRITYELWTEQDGLRAGMSIELTNEVWSISAETLYIRRLQMEIIGKSGDRRRYHLQLGDTPPDGARSARQEHLQIGRVEADVARVGDAVFDVDAPAAPSALGAGNVTTGVSLDADGAQIVWVEITWSSVSDSDLDHYEIQISTAGDFASDLVTRQHAADGDRRERFTGLVGNTTYYVRVRAADWVGNYSLWDYGLGSPYSFTTSRDTTPPDQVAGLSAGSSRTLVGLAWTANTEADLRHYEIQRAPDSGGSPGAWTTQAYAALNFYIDQAFTDEEISGEDTFWYRVRAIDTSSNQGDWATHVDAKLGQITGDHIAAHTITAAHIAANTITATEIAAHAITATQIAASTITADRLSVTALSAITADMGTLTAGEIRVGTGTVGVDFTGFRIMSSYIAGYNGEVFQAGLRSSDGAFVAAAGDLRIDEDCITITTPSTFDLSKNINWYNGSYVFGSLGGYHGSGTSVVRLWNDEVGRDNAPYIYLTSAAATDNDAVVYIGAYCGQPGITSKYALLSVAAGPTQRYVHVSSRLSVGGLLIVGGYVTSNAFMSYGATLYQWTADDEILAMKSYDVDHDMTDLAEADTFGTLAKDDGDHGGLKIVGYKDGDVGRALSLVGRLDGTANTTKGTAGRGVVSVIAQIRSSNAVGAVGADGNLFAIINHGNARFLFDAEGSAHADVEWTTYDEYDDVALLADLERAMLAQTDPVTTGFVEFLRYNHAELENAGIVHFDRQNPGHAMLNTTRLSMLLVGALRQIGERVTVLDGQLQAIEHGGVR
jgi:hypothetical protein